MNKMEKKLKCREKNEHYRKKNYNIFNSCWEGICRKNKIKIQ